MFLIFEARTENPHGKGFEGCRATANFWRSLTDERHAESRARRLEQFYYRGIPGTAGPVVQAKKLRISTRAGSRQLPFNLPR